jgi:polyisoprenoid-binding protein YceI
VRTLLVAVCSLGLAAAASAQQRAIDFKNSTLTIRVYKTGFFSAFAHNHEIKAPIASGSADTSAHPSAEVHVDARALRVMDPEVSEKDRAEIQKTMLGPEVLDSERFHGIVFQSTAAESAGAGRWTLHGNLTLHGVTKPVAMEVVLKDGMYTGHATLKQSEFGIKPVRVAGGTVKVKDEVRIEFEVRLVL